MKHLSVILTLFYLSLAFPLSVNASLIKITNDGQAVWKVLAIQDEITLTVPERSSFSVKDVSSSGVDNPSSLQLKSLDGKISMLIEGSFGSKEMDVTKVSNEIIEIEQEFEAQKVVIGAKNNVFTISQNGIIAETESPLSVLPKDRAIALSTESGVKYISILPKEAVDSLVRPKIITHLPKWTMRLSDDPVSGPRYEIEGERVITPFSLFSYSVPVKAFVSASTGEVLSVEKPTWYSVLGFLFS